MKLTIVIITQASNQRMKYSGIRTAQCSAERPALLLAFRPATEYATQYAISPITRVITKSHMGFIGKLSGSVKKSSNSFNSF